MMLDLYKGNVPLLQPFIYFIHSFAHFPSFCHHHTGKETFQEHSLVPAKTGSNNMASILKTYTWIPGPAQHPQVHPVLLCLEAAP